jgi:putative hydrolase of the HAD superfamily
MIKAWIFDLDDTLYPESDYVRSGFRAVGEWAERRLGLSQPIVRSELQSLFDADFRSDSFQWWLADRGLPESLLPEMVQAYRDHSPQVEFFPETSRVLDALKKTFRLGLVTQGRRTAQEAKIRALGLDHWMNAIVILGEEDRAEWKPNREPFYRALAMLSVAGGDAAYVGDNPQKDFRGAREAGLHTVRIRRPGGFHTGDEPATAEDAPDREIHSLDQLLEQIDWDITVPG